MEKDAWERYTVVACSAPIGEDGMTFNHPIVSDGERTFMARDIVADPKPSLPIGPREMEEQIKEGNFLKTPPWVAKRAHVTLALSVHFCEALALVDWSDQIVWTRAYGSRIAYVSREQERAWESGAAERLLDGAERRLADRIRHRRTEVDIEESRKLVNQALYVCNRGAMPRSRCLLLKAIAYEDDDVRHDHALLELMHEACLPRKEAGEAVQDMRKRLMTHPV